MAIRIIREPDIHLTAGELARLRREYDDFMRHYCGVMTFEEFVRNRRPRKEPSDV
jgi:hypothetical protein